MNLIIDAGNTRVKVAVFEQSTLMEVLVIDIKFFLSEIKKILKKHKISYGILSSVSFIPEKKGRKIKIFAQFSRFIVFYKGAFYQFVRNSRNSRGRQNCIS